MHLLSFIKSLLNLNIFCVQYFSPPFPFFLDIAAQSIINNHGLRHEKPPQKVCFSKRNIGRIYCTCFNFTAVLFLFLSSPWGSVYRFLHSIFSRARRTEILSFALQICQFCALSNFLSPFQYKRTKHLNQFKDNVIKVIIVIPNLLTVFKACMRSQ